MLPKLKRVRNVLTNDRAGDDLGWQVSSEFDRARQLKPFVAGHPASNQEEAALLETSLALDLKQEYLIDTMANRKQVID